MKITYLPKSNYLLTFLFLTLTFFAQGQLEENLVAYYPFEKGKVRDCAGFGDKGRIYGNLQTIKGVNGHALYFNGGNQNIVFKGSVNRFLRGRRDFTISFYFKTDDLNQQSSILGKRTRCDGYKMIDLRLANGKLYAELHEQESPEIKNNISATIPDDKWHQYVYTRKGNTVRLFVDGVLEDSHQLPRVISIDDVAYFGINVSPCIGVNKTGNLHGAIDELEIYSVALSEREVGVLFNINNPTTYQELRGRISDEDISQKNKKTLDPRLNDIFGKYEDEATQSTFVLDRDSFILKIKNPKGYQANELVYTGKYKIEAGDLYLLNGEVTLTRDDEARPHVIPYDQKIIAELYKDGIDIFAFEHRMQFLRNNEIIKNE